MLRILLLNSLLLLIVSFSADGADFKIRTRAMQNLTGEKVPAPEVYLVRKGSSDTIRAVVSYKGDIDKNGNMTVVTDIAFDVPREKAEYTLHGYAEGFRPVTRSVHIPRPGSREFETVIPDLVFYPEPNRLPEVTVTATKVKFYVKGDTIVYNADAFQTPRGSMLDALIKQLPGVEVRGNGQIYVNGRFVESLVMNGKDFFKGDNSIMLNNLGAYTVKDIAVYEKWSDRSMLAGRDLGDSRYTIDVRLKKEYMSGFIGNMEAGGGTHSRYLGRLFGMWHTAKSRVALVGNINNLNDSRKPGQSDNFKSSGASGELRARMAGLDYSTAWGAWSFSGSTTFAGDRNSRDASTHSANFLSGGDTYETRFGRSLSHALSLTTRNGASLKSDSRVLSVGQNLGYEKSDMASSALSGTFNSEMRDLTLEMLELVYSGAGGTLSDICINSALTRALKTGSSLKAGGGAYFSSKIPHTPDLVELRADCSYTRNKSRAFNRYDINFNESGLRRTDYSYTDGTPDHSVELQIRPSYLYLPSENVSLSVYPEWQHTASDRNSDFYRLDRLGDAGVFGALPADYASALDAGQSHRSRHRDDYLSLRFDLIGSRQARRGRWSYQVSPRILYAWRALGYEQEHRVQRVRHNSAAVDFYNTFLLYRAGKNSWKVKYERRTELVKPDRLVDITDTRDPLNIFMGAKGLKNSAANTVDLSWVRTAGGRHASSLIVGCQLSFTENALVNGLYYDETTGVRRYRAFNVSGNRAGRLHGNYSKSFGGRDQFSVTSRSLVRHELVADMVSSGGGMEKSTVENTTLGQSLEFAWRIGRQKIGISGRVDWRDTRSDNSGFEPFSAESAQYGLTGEFALPFGLGLSTDLNVYARRGYAYSELNTTDIVWNARLSYGVKGGKWLVMLDGFDLLRQLSNVTYNVNAQGRTETFTNVLPRYALLHIQYRFDVHPKKRK